MKNKFKIDFKFQKQEPKWGKHTQFAKEENEGYTQRVRKFDIYLAHYPNDFKYMQGANVKNR